MRGHLDTSTEFKTVLPFDTTNGSPDVTAGETTNLYAHMDVSGAGIPAGAKIESITNSTSFKLTANATADGTHTNLTFTHITDVNRYGFVFKQNYALSAQERYTTSIRTYYDGSISSKDQETLYLNPTSHALIPIIKTILNPRWVTSRSMPKYIDINYNPLKADVKGLTEISSVETFTKA